MPSATTTPAAPSRRTFLKNGALGACKGGAADVAQAAAPMSHGGTTPAAPAPSAPPPHTTVSLAEKRRRADEMDAMHEKGVKAFPAMTEGKGNQLMTPRLDGGVKVFELTASVMKWETAPGQWVEGWAYNGQVPGPQIRVREGDRAAFSRSRAA